MIRRRAQDSHPEAWPWLLWLADNLVVARFPLLKRASAAALVAAVPAWASRIIETTSGTMGLALAEQAAAAGLPLTLVTPPLGASFSTHLRVFGDTRLIEISGDQRARLAIVQAEIAADPALHWPNQYANPLVAAAYTPIGEVLASLGAGALVAAVGSGGSAMGLSQPMRDRRPESRLIAVDAMNSVLFGRPDGPRSISGIGNSIQPPLLTHECFDVVHWMSDDLMASEARRMARNSGLFLGPTGAAATKAARFHASRDADTLYVAVAPDEGHRYLETVFQPALDVDQAEPQIMPRRLGQTERGPLKWISSDWGRQPISLQTV